VKHLAKHKAEKFQRRCLKCLRKFTGVGMFNRICNSCTIENSRQSNLKGA
jgi:rRNA maturation endonuclease Nob1